MGYLWANWFQQISYDWSGFLSLFAYKPRWTNPTSDMPKRTNLNTEPVSSSVPMNWPAEYQGSTLNLSVGQNVWQGSVPHAGQPVQRVDKSKTRTFWIDQKYGGEVIIDGVSQGYKKAGERWSVEVPRPVREAQDGWAVEGYPNAGNRGDRHWFGLEDDGTAHECIWLGIGTDTMLDYCKYAPDGSLLTGSKSAAGFAGVVKGCISWLSVAWNAGDKPHRLGMGMSNLARLGVNGVPSDGTRDDWTEPAYGQVFRLAPEVYNRLSATADEEQQNFLDSLFYYGIMPYDVGGAAMGTVKYGGGVGMVAGAQHKDSSVGKLEIKFTDLELAI